MPELIRPSTQLPARRQTFTVTTSDGLRLIGEVAAPISENEQGIGILCLHPLPTAGGMMDSHVYKKAANRLPAMAGITVVRFNTRGTTSEAGTSEGTFDGGESEGFDVAAMIDYCFENVKIKKLWVVGWSFGTDLALQHARDPRVLGLILLSPPLRRTTEDELKWWSQDGRPVVALIPEFDDYLQPAEAAVRFAPLKQMQLIPVAEAKHLWVGELAVYRVLTEIVKVVAPQRLPLPTEY
jgi:alpha/beta superfamily hydrolase